MMKMLKVAVMAGAMMAFGQAAFAKGAAPAQNHHCKMADGTVDQTKTKKQCHEAKGTWAKDAAPAKAEAAPAKAEPAKAEPAPAKAADPAPAKAADPAPAKK